MIGGDRGLHDGAAGAAGAAAAAAAAAAGGGGWSEWVVLVLEGVGGQWWLWGWRLKKPPS